MMNSTDSTDLVQQFSTEDLPRRARLPVYRDVIGRSVGNFEVTPCEDEFQFRATTLDLPGMSVARISCSAVRVERRRDMATDDARDLTLALFHDGAVAARQSGHEAQIRSGGAFLFSSHDPLVMERSASRLTNYSLLRAELAPALSDIDAALMEAIPVDSEAIQLLAHYTDLVADRVLVSEEFSRIAARHIHDLIALAIGATREASNVARARGLRAARRADLRDRAARFISLRFNDPNLTPDAIADGLGVSTRLLQKIFAEHGKTLMIFLRDERIRRATNLLSSSEASDRSITDIAFACGFNDSSHFGRVFAAHKGMTPSKWRKQQR
jgi:AraC-like DNA-binding protein